MNNKSLVFGLISVVAAILGIISDSTILRLVAVIILAGSSTLIGIALGSKPFKS